jgi:hypothetical protein
VPGEEQSESFKNLIDVTTVRIDPIRAFTIRAATPTSLLYKFIRAMSEVTQNLVSRLGKATNENWTDAFRMISTFQIPEVSMARGETQGFLTAAVRGATKGSLVGETSKLSGAQ